jgi:predicted Zn-dependent protease
VNSAIDAWLFGPGLPPAGRAAFISLEAGALVIRNGEHQFRPSMHEVSLREVGFGRPGIELAWSQSGEQWAVHVLNAANAKRLLSIAEFRHTASVAALKRSQQRALRWRRFSMATLATLLLAPLLLLILFFLNADPIADWIVSRIPIDQEIKFGQSALEQFRAEQEIIDSGPAFDAVATIGARLSKGSKYPFQFHLADDETLNAFALPGGVVVVNKGLVAATKRSEELAGVIAHEVQHVEYRHSLVNLVKQMGFSALWSMAIGDLVTTLAGRAALELTGLKFSRDAEAEADDKGFDALVAADIDPSGMPDFFETMEKSVGDAPSGFLSSHPLSHDRKLAMQEKLQALGNRHFEALQFTPWPPPIVPTQ